MTTAARWGWELLDVPTVDEPNLVDDDVIGKIRDIQRWVDALSQGYLEQVSLTAPPGSPTEGKVWFVDATATGAWAGHDNELAGYFDGAWSFCEAPKGMLVYVVNADNWQRYEGAGSWLTAQI